MNNLTNKIFKQFPLFLSIILLIIWSFFISISPVLADTFIVKMGTDSGALKFQPSEFTVQQGDTIKWVNNRLAPHNVIFNDPKVKGMSHPQLLFAPGDFFETFVPQDISGEFDFYCQPHRGAGMVGTMTIQ